MATASWVKAEAPEVERPVMASIPARLHDQVDACLFRGGELVPDTRRVFHDHEHARGVALVLGGVAAVRGGFVARGQRVADLFE
jgi:hypothetical protein